MSVFFRYFTLAIVKLGNRHFTTFQLSKKISPVFDITLGASHEFHSAKFFLCTQTRFLRANFIEMPIMTCDKGVFVFILTPFTVISNSPGKLPKKDKKSIFDYICMLMPSAGRTEERGGPHAARGPPVGDPCFKGLLI